VIRRAIAEAPWAGREYLHGDAPGVDRIAGDYLTALGLKVTKVPAEWWLGGVYDSAAGYKRNIKMLRQCDAVVAIYDGVSNGTAHTINEAFYMGLPLWVRLCWPEEPSGREGDDSL
jgi:hypothetical protein